MKRLLHVLKPALPGMVFVMLTGCACCAIPDLPPDPRLADYRIEGARLVQGGYEYRYRLTTETCCPPQSVTVQEPVRWSVWPYADGMKLDFERGRLELSKILPDDYRGTLTAHVKDVGDVEIVLHSRALDPLNGRWRQVGDIECQSGREYLSSSIGELQLSRSGFAVTWEPFETYQDFWGDVAVDDEAGGIRFTVTGSNAEPSHQEYAGRYRIDKNGRLVLDGVSFQRDRFAPGSCGQVFALSPPDAGFPLNQPSSNGLSATSENDDTPATGTALYWPVTVGSAIYLADGATRELGAIQVSGDAASKCLLVAKPHNSEIKPIAYFLGNEAVSVSTDFWGAGEDWSVTLSEGGESGRHLSLMFDNEALYLGVTSRLQSLLSDCQAEHLKSM